VAEPGYLLVLDTATQIPVVALAEGEGRVVASRAWASRQQHGEQLLERLDELLAEVGAAPAVIGGVIVGRGPGSFTGLRIGLATAKVLAHSLSVPLVGVSTTRALAQAAAVHGEVAVSLPAGVADLYVHRFRLDADGANERAAAGLVAGADAFADAVAGATLIAVDLAPERVGEEAVLKGQRALDGLATALAKLGAVALAAGESDDVAMLVPAYVALPRGIARTAAEMQWSPDLR
jgi:tRNA threonylcarbamoyl adenosine modification protein YeaZ